MAQLPRMTGDRPVLLYRATCPKCRLLSGMIVGLSGGWIRRVPIDTPEALRLYTQFGQPQGRLALLYRGSFRTGLPISIVALMALFEGLVGGAARGLAPGLIRGRHRND